MFKNITLGIVFCGLQFSASAEQFNTTPTIKTIFTGPSLGNLVFIGMDTRPTQTRPNGCGENADFDFVLDLNTSFGKENYSAILAAYAAKRTVRLISADSCSIHSSVPGLSTIWLK
ncbi:hypothetical protein LZP73_18920 [Shewanella sp. AS16]|uniref:hypothetical protein n=1 Tax=Shewanella sp. AS16 TaxID=2907625 RepID=UPI001F405E0D|nr:hypothetical protein [Shewanella sp. AS16]MCE9688246.1 hypothetical protein [Shewanella sp. AS16]